MLKSPLIDGSITMNKNQADALHGLNSGSVNLLESSPRLGQPMIQEQDGPAENDEDIQDDYD